MHWWGTPGSGELTAPQDPVAGLGGVWKENKDGADEREGK